MTTKPRIAWRTSSLETLAACPQHLDRPRSQLARELLAVLNRSVARTTLTPPDVDPAQPPMNISSSRWERA